MSNWMNDVDKTLRSILHEVNTPEEFEQEKTVFQVSNFYFKNLFQYGVNCKNNNSL